HADACSLPRSGTSVAPGGEHEGRGGALCAWSGALGWGGLCSRWPLRDWGSGSGQGSLERRAAVRLSCNRDRFSTQCVYWASCSAPKLSAPAASGQEGPDSCAGRTRGAAAGSDGHVTLGHLSFWRRRQCSAAQAREDALPAGSGRHPVRLGPGMAALLRTAAASVVRPLLHLRPCAANPRAVSTLLPGSPRNAGSVGANLLRPSAAIASVLSSYLLPRVQPALGFKTKGVIKKRCKDCYRVRRRGRWFIYCKTNPRHKQRQM
ncbi:large ribosomal subunit protein bL36m, partial [Tamandua tetradactyla]|uniref:large ribosomal subunit protein bL36m n=1 Tax=Tamandua tetradactyla TaxID=48850 RepID=UPI0040547528